MAWNEPGGNKPKDPWGGGGDQGPPDLDEALKNLKDKINSVFGGKGGKLGDQLEGMLRGRDKGRRAPRARKRSRGSKGGPAYGQSHPKNPKARLY